MGKCRNARVFFAELKKILRPLPVFIVAAFIVVYFTFYIVPNFNRLNEPDVKDQYAYSVVLHENYGAVLDAEERAKASALFSEYQEKSLLSKNEAIFGNNALKFYDAFQESTDVMRYCTFPNITIPYEVKPLTSSELLRSAEILGSDEIEGTMSDVVIPNGAIIYFPIAIILSVSALLAPLITRDRQNHVSALQYASKRGRRTLMSQFAAAMTTAFLVTTAQLFAFAVLLFTSPAGEFLDAPINSFSVFRQASFWFSGSFGEYLLLLTSLVYLLAFACAGFMFTFSNRSKNYISLLFKVVPFVFLLGFASMLLSDYPLAFRNGDTNYSLAALTHVPYIEFWLLGFLCALGMEICALVLKRHKTAENI